MELSRKTLLNSQAEAVICTGLASSSPAQGASHFVTWTKFQAIVNVCGIYKSPKPSTYNVKPSRHLSIAAR